MTEFKGFAPKVYSWRKNNDKEEISKGYEKMCNKERN